MDSKEIFYTVRHPNFTSLRMKLLLEGAALVTVVGAGLYTQRNRNTEIQDATAHLIPSTRAEQTLPSTLPSDNEFSQAQQEALKRLPEAQAQALIARTNLDIIVELMENSTIPEVREAATMYRFAHEDTNKFDLLPFITTEDIQKPVALQLIGGLGVRVVLSRKELAEGNVTMEKLLASILAQKKINAIEGTTADKREYMGKAEREAEKATKELLARGHSR